MGLRLPALFAVFVATASIATGVPLPSPTDGIAPSGQDADTAPNSLADGPAQRAADSSVVALSNSTNYLTVQNGAVSTARFGNATLDVASAAAIDDGQFETRFSETATQRAFRNAGNDSIRTAVLDQASRDIENQTVALATRQERAVQQFNDGTIATTTFLQRLAVLDTRAHELQTIVDRLLQTARNEPGYSLPIGLQTRLESLRAEPNLLQGPVRHDVGDALAGDRDQLRVYVETTDDGVVLARLSGDRYVREAYRTSERLRTGDDQFAAGDEAPINAAYDRARELYPWAVDNGITTPSANGYGNTPIYRITLDHTQGRLVTYIDGTSTNVVREIQEQRLDTLPVRATASNGTENLTIDANLTYESGPMELTVRDPSANETLDARVTVDDEFVGTTGADGSLWAIHPTGPTTVRVRTVGNETTSLQLPAGQPEP